MGREGPSLLASEPELTSYGLPVRPSGPGRDRRGPPPPPGAVQRRERTGRRRGRLGGRARAWKKSRRGSPRAPQIPGRLERIAEEPVSVLIDFAHTPDALERVLATLRPLVTGRLLVLFGAGGDGTAGSDPRWARSWPGSPICPSSPPTIPGPRIRRSSSTTWSRGWGRLPSGELVDRREAIAAALAEARPGDLVLLAGKGHETYQVIGPGAAPLRRRAHRPGAPGRSGRGGRP